MCFSQVYKKTITFSEGFLVSNVVLFLYASNLLHHISKKNSFFQLRKQMWIEVQKRNGMVCQMFRKWILIWLKMSKVISNFRCYFHFNYGMNIQMFNCLLLQTVNIFCSIYVFAFQKEFFFIFVSFSDVQLLLFHSISFYHPQHLKCFVLSACDCYSSIISCAKQMKKSARRIRRSISIAKRRKLSEHSSPAANRSSHTKEAKMNAAHTKKIYRRKMKRKESELNFVRVIWGDPIHTFFAFEHLFYTVLCYSLKSFKCYVCTILLQFTHHVVYIDIVVLHSRNIATHTHTHTEKRDQQQIHKIKQKCRRLDIDRRWMVNNVAMSWKSISIWWCSSAKSFPVSFFSFCYFNQTIICLPKKIRFFAWYTTISIHNSSSCICNRFFSYEFPIL